MQFTIPPREDKKAIRGLALAGCIFAALILGILSLATYLVETGHYVFALVLIAVATTTRVSFR